MEFRHIKRTKKIIAFLTALALSVSGTYFSDDIISASTVSGDTASSQGAASTEELDMTAEGSDFMVKELGAVTCYRWEKITNYYEIYDQEEWTRIMFIKDDSYIAAEVEKDLFFDDTIHSADVTPLKNHTTSKYDISSAKGYAWSDGIDSLDELYIKARDWWSSQERITKLACYSIDTDDIDIAFIPDRAFNFSQKDPMIKPDLDVFFTDDDRNVPYVRYRGKNKNGDREWDMAFAKDDDSKKYYLDIKQTQTGKPIEDAYVHPINGIPFADHGARSEYNKGGLRIHPEGESHKGVFIRIKDNGNEVYIEDSTDARKWDNEYFITLTRDAINGCYVRYNWKKRHNITFTAYKGTPVHFSTLDKETVVSENMVFNVSAGNYVDAAGNKKTTEGVMLNNGAKLVIDGGVVSVKGTFINNGTIEIKNGGVLLIQDGASVSSFLAGSNIDKNGCGSIKCSGGDIIIENGGALYAGMNDDKGKIVPFYLDNYSTLINCGLLVYGEMRLGKGTRLELRGNSLKNRSTTIGNVFKGTELGKEIPLGQFTFDMNNPDDVQDYKSMVAKGYRMDKSNFVSGIARIVGGFDYQIYDAYDYERGDPLIADNDYDILGKYTGRIKNSTSDLPASCRGLHIVTKVGGLTGSDPGSVTILRYKYSLLDPVLLFREKSRGFNITNYDSSL